MRDISKHGWAEKIRSLMQTKHLKQAELAELLGVTAPTVSRWLNGKNEPAPQTYVALGNLAAAPDDVYFWERAGVRLKHAEEAPLKRSLGSFEVSAAQFPSFASARISRPADGNLSLIAIPLFGVCAYADEMPPPEHLSLEQAEVEEMMTAPLSWCPHPDRMIGMHVCGESMFPTMQNDALIVVDLAENDRERLNHELVVVSHRDLGLKVARLQHLTSCYVLVPANEKCMPIDITSASKWKILGKIVWWVTRDQVSRPVQP